MRHLIKNDFEKIRNEDSLYLLDFYADWCGPCKQLTPILEETAKELKEVEFCKVNIEDCQDLAKEFSISAVPTIILYHKGVKFRKVGVMTRSEIRDHVTKYIESISTEKGDKNGKGKN